MTCKRAEEKDTGKLLEKCNKMVKIFSKDLNEKKISRTAKIVATSNKTYCISWYGKRIRNKKYGN